MPDRRALQQANRDLQDRLLERTRALGEIEALYAAIFNSTFTLAGLSTIDGVVLEVNRSALEAVGARIEDVVGKHLWEAPWFAQTPEEARRVGEVFRTKPGQFVRYEATVKFPDGKWRTFDFSMRPVGHGRRQRSFHGRRRARSDRVA